MDKLAIDGGNPVRKNLLPYGHQWIDEEDIALLNPLVDGYGMGTSISNTKVVDFSMDIVEVEGTSIAKRGKMSGSKRVVRCNRCLKDRVLPLDVKERRCKCGGKFIDLLEGVIKKGRVRKKLPAPQEIRASVLKDLKNYQL